MQFVTTIKRRPALHDAVARINQSTRVCSEDGCTKPGAHVQGYYLSGTRRVRVWVCIDHWVGTANNLLPTPQWVLDGIRAEEEHFLQMQENYRLRRHGYNSDSDTRGVSVKTLAPGGHGDPIPFDRVKNWRWGA